MPNEREIKEIEAILNEALIILPDEQDGKYPILVGVRKAARAVAALRAQDREDGAREMRERAAQACNQVERDSNERSEYGDGVSGGAAKCAEAIEALPLSTRTEDGDGR